jgi:hypothetical protein
MQAGDRPLSSLAKAVLEVPTSGVKWRFRFTVSQMSFDVSCDMAQRISGLIAACIASVADGFDRVNSRPGFWFRRFGSPLFSFIVVQHSAKCKCFEVDVVSTVFPSWDRQYDTHQLRRAIGLSNMRVGSKMILMEDVLYRYKTDPGEALETIGQELRRYALPWFDAHLREMDEDALVQHGFAQIAEAQPGNINLEALKWSLRKEADKVGGSKWQQKETAILAADLRRWSAVRQLTNG